MKNISTLFRHDLKLARRNVIAIIVLFGVVIIPSFFAWFNVLSSWDPFGNVKNLKVAVANADDGYMSELFPLRINVGEQVIAQLRANSDLNWVFTSEEEAIQGTEAEEYYAALVLPPDFSREMMTFLAPDAKPAEIEYYTNEKKNALSPKITGEAATEVSTKINESFTKTLNEVGLALVSSVAQQLETPEAQDALNRFEMNLDELATELHSASDTAQIFSSLVASSKPLVESADSLTGASVDAIRETTGAIGTGADAVSTLRSTLDTASGSLAAAFAASASSYENLAQQVDRLYASLGSQANDARGILTSVRNEVGAHIDHYTTLRDGVQQLADEATDPLVTEALEAVVRELDSVIATQELLQDRIDRGISEIDQGVANSNATRDEIKALVNDAKASVESAQGAYTRTLQPKLEELAGTLSSVSAGFTSIGNDIESAAAALSGGSGSLLDSLTIAEEITSDTAETLDEVAVKFEEVAGSLGQALDSGDLTEVTDLIGKNPEILAGELTTPVGLKTIPVFKVDNFGTQMAPFYTVLGLWVGALLLSVLIRVEVDRSLLPTMAKPLSLTQEYIGRYGIFVLLGFLQSTILYVGLIGFVGVQPAHPFLLILAGWLMSTVFSLITYTLVVSFGEAGKALAVILLVLQISGGGGAYPLSVLPQWFQNASPFLPVSHATNAVRAALAGIYEGDYWWHILGLLAFIVPTLLLGLLLRLPLIKVNEDLDRALGSTKLMWRG